ncbi:hypothetical protein D3C71_1399140 [compost metagenome]
MVIDVVERTALVHQLEVVPVFAAHESAAIAVLQLQVVHALEDLREGFALLEIQAVVVIGSRRRIASGALRVEVGNEVRVGAANGPAGADRQCGIETAFDFADAEILGKSLWGYCGCDGDCQQMWVASSTQSRNAHASSDGFGARKPDRSQRCGTDSVVKKWRGRTDRAAVGFRRSCVAGFPRRVCAVRSSALCRRWSAAVFRGIRRCAAPCSRRSVHGSGQ